MFDLDNTLYPSSCDLFAEIDVRMTDFVANFLSLHPDEARALQKQYYADHGTTLKGMMVNHGMSPDAFLAYVHDIDHSPLPVSARLRVALQALPGRKFVFTNGSLGHATGVTRAMQIHDVFDGFFGIEDALFQPKPHNEAFDRFVAAHGVNPENAVFFEDLSRNLAPAWRMGFATVLVQSDKDWRDEPDGVRPARAGDEVPDHVDYVIDDLTDFLEQVIA
ncbi:MAG: pyrimidine 5'-nucleotidase [Pseudomonadota bacterium]